MQTVSRFAPLKRSRRPRVPVKAASFPEESREDLCFYAVAIEGLFNRA